ncbi:GntR family transcriptional regulator [Maribrevibacterium harenarium]|uniref:GntR family transcriptional regulator n=1 Tax=Maribrevibacterium harenarium TaxID=2589817 RepID=UPI001F41EEE0|nr:GntR family transcriptional regulator [Maribrevibacterium harenarium]
MKRAVVRQSLADVICADLTKRILSGELQEGELIRQEMLADEYDVSRMPIREALKRLDGEGLVRFQNNRGATVVKHSLEEIAEIFDVRILLEVDLFARAIGKMTIADFSRCEDILATMHASYQSGDVAAWGPLNAEYHSALYQAAGRQLTSQLLERVSKQANRYVSMHIDQLQKRHSAEQDHTKLLELARAGQVEEALAVLREHLTNTKEQVLALIQANRAS